MPKIPSRSDDSQDRRTEHYRMARKAPQKFIPIEERPEFLAQVARLAGVDFAEFPERARAVVALHHDAVITGDLAQMDATHCAFEALVYVLNGNTLFGSRGDSQRAVSVLARAVAAEPGRVPCWGQSGEFLLEIDGMRIRVEVEDGLKPHHGVALHAIDLDRPFVSDTGYRHHGVDEGASLGLTVDQAVRRAVGQLINEVKPKRIKDDAYLRTKPPVRPKWLADALAGVQPDGQLAMFGDAPISTKRPAKSNAQRQREHRQKRRQLKEQQGLQPVLLSERERKMIELIRSSGTQQPGLTDFPLASEVDSVEAEFKHKLANRVITGRSIQFDDVVIDLLPLRDQTLLRWAQRNEELVAATPADQAYPDDPKARNVLGKALNDLHELRSRYQMLLEVTRELYEMLDVSQASPRLSSPAGFVQEYKRYSESWAVTRDSESDGVTRNRLSDIGKGFIRPKVDSLPETALRLVNEVGLLKALAVLAECADAASINELTN